MEETFRVIRMPAFFMNYLAVFELILSIMNLIQRKILYLCGQLTHCLYINF